MRNASGEVRAWWWTLVVLVAFDVLIYRVGLLWHVKPDFGTDLAAYNWRLLYAAAAEFESGKRDAGLVATVGSSVVIFGADDGRITSDLESAGIRARILRFATHGSTATDSALMAWNALSLEPWLVVYGVAARDFPKKAPIESYVSELFYDSSADLPALPRHGPEERFEAYVKRYWDLYRYRYFTRAVLYRLAMHPIRWLGFTPPAFAAEPPASSSIDAERYFGPVPVTPEAFAAWEHWRSTRRFDDYLEWLRKAAASIVLGAYERQTLERFGPENNPHVSSLRWMLARLRARGVRVLLVYMPENAVFRDPKAARYYDRRLSDTYADLLAREAANYGAHFEDLRGALEPDDFWDLVHPNVVGERKLSDKIADLIAAEWRASMHDAGSAR